MKNQEIVAKLWKLCDVLRSDGITCHQYVTELTYILFLKMTKETSTEGGIPEQYRWDVPRQKSGIELKRYYRDLFQYLGEGARGCIQEIYAGASTNIDEPKNLEEIIKSIDALDWFTTREEGLGNLYEGLLEKNVNEKKSGAGQYLTPHVLIDAMVHLTKPQPGELCNDPAYDTFGSTITAFDYVHEHIDKFFDLNQDETHFEIRKAFIGVELVHDTHRFALMNAMLHSIEAPITLSDTPSPLGKYLKNFDVILTNPSFGTKKGGKRATRDDLTFPTLNKQLNFLQHIHRSLKSEGRAVIVLPDNVFFADGDNKRIRQDFMDKCNVHTILCLPAGIFYAQGVKTNVPFFQRGKTDKGNTKRVWYYDLRTNVPSFGRRIPLTREHFTDFETAYEAGNREAVNDEHWSSYSREEIATKEDTFDLGFMKQETEIVDWNNYDPAKQASEAADLLEEAGDLLRSLAKDLTLTKGE